MLMLALALGFRSLPKVQLYIVLIPVVCYVTSAGTAHPGLVLYIVLFVLYLHFGSFAVSAFEQLVVTRLKLSASHDSNATTVGNTVADRLRTVYRKIQQSIEAQSAGHALSFFGAYVGILIASIWTNDPGSAFTINMFTLFLFVSLSLLACVLDMARCIMRAEDLPATPGSHWADFAYGLTELRTLALLNTWHNTSLLICSISIALALCGFVVMPVTFVSALLVTSLLLVQIPFAFGQWRTREQILTPFQGADRKLKEEELTTKFAPVFPRSNIASSFVSSGVGAAILYVVFKLLDKKIDQIQSLPTWGIW